MRRIAQPVLPFEGIPHPNSKDSSGGSMTPTLAASSTRAMGAYYTPSVAAQTLVRWALRRRGDRVLEPSMGDGAFLCALDRDSRRRRLDAEVWGIEMAADTFEATVAVELVDPRHAIRDDFLAVKPFEVDAVVGNPPYVRLRHLPTEQNATALAVTERVLGEGMDPAGSVWMAFVLHATQFLARGGRLAFVLPYDLTYVRYARPLWRFLGQHFEHIRVIRVHERMFPDILQEVVLLLADGFGASTGDVLFEAYETVERLERQEPAVRSAISVQAIVDGKRAFLEALLSDEATALLRDRLEALTVPASSVVTFNIGYVCGDKSFFHPDPATIAHYQVPPSSLRHSLTSSRQLRGIGLRTSAVPVDRFSRLFLPPAEPSSLTAGERRYIADGEDYGVSRRYKCRIRDPWYVTPYVRIPDVLIPVFTEKPAMLVNDAGVVASNSLLCGYLRASSAEALACAWFTSLTTLQLELQVHALGGGVMVLVPREAGSVRLPIVSDVHRGHIDALHELLADGKLDLAFSAGDESVLRDVIGLGHNEVTIIQEAAETLAHWRTAARSAISVTSLDQDVEEEQTALECIDDPIDERRDMKVAVGD